MTPPIDSPTPCVQATLSAALERARESQEGAPASYIPELANVDLEQTSVAVCDRLGNITCVGDAATHRFTLQSTGKLILLIGLLEERGASDVFSRVGSEPTGTNFASIARLDNFGPAASNPLVNAGAITLAGSLSGSLDERQAWIRNWAQKLIDPNIELDEDVYMSECSTADRNRSIAYLLKSNGRLASSVEETLSSYFYTCSLRTDIRCATFLPALLARGGRDKLGKQIISPETSCQVVSLMATCGMYNESGNYLRETGLPAKSGVSGLIVAVAPRVAGIAVCSPRLNLQGGSVRGHMILRDIAHSQGWHFSR